MPGAASPNVQNPGPTLAAVLPSLGSVRVPANSGSLLSPRNVSAWSPGIRSSPLMYGPPNHPTGLLDLPTQPVLLHFAIQRTKNDGSASLRATSSGTVIRRREDCTAKRGKPQFPRLRLQVQGTHKLHPRGSGGASSGALLWK